MSTTAPRLLQVARTERITPAMIRVTLTGEELADFPGHGPDRRIKMFFPVEGQERPAVPRASTGGPVWPAGEARPAIRTYTVRRFSPDAGEHGELDVDFVVHAGHGPAAAWATTAAPGAWVGVSEPGGRWEPDPDAEHHLVIGDESALPAVATVLETLAADHPAVPVRAVIEVADAGEEQRLPGAAVVDWVHRGDAPAGTPLVEAVRAATLPDGRGQAWLSGESAAVKELRGHLLTDRGFDRRAVYATGYWRAR
ncbi:MULTISPECIES: siderophore-interacting protein [Pseudonocardia]|uniref:Vibriobactin utilization protein ViuB n=2 Tax=Pseudonocardia TaxID=1847 RepID=A0A1Y2MW99_PSEAH|nr:MULTISPECIES: siderophore-interacting protein [Pseudonocardia]OSY39249.1 Vibriobactin utilization protein ViuB [Pseudonocardia autotrophica]TDN76529.1 NADPH-dependent ferric siderophore reductase [Pseudonocardia autotrophica]BBG00529.1 siderophore-interacting protein [Pseudonocardia autotrophica]GEC26489.1 siderophore-interacting protein [Pseudonocardia saturnea]